MTLSASHTPTPSSSALWSLGCLFVLKGSSDELEVIEAVVPPGYSPPMHRHDFGTESFYVLEGSVRFVVGDRDEVHGPGGVAHVARSVPHSFEVLGDQPARVLDLVAPAGLWGFFTECGEPAGDLRLPDEIRIPEDLPEIIARHRGTFLGPPLNRPALRLQPAR